MGKKLTANFLARIKQKWEIPFESKIIHFCEQKNIILEELTTVQRELIEFLCKNVRSEIYLDFEFNKEKNWLVNSTYLMLIGTSDNILMKIDGYHKKSLELFKETNNFLHNERYFQICGNTFSKELFEISLKILSINDQDIIVGYKLDQPLRLCKGCNYIIFLAPQVIENYQ